MALAIPGPEIAGAQLPDQVTTVRIRRMLQPGRGDDIGQRLECSGRTT